MCLFGSNYPHACRPFPFSLFLSISLVVRCCVAAFPFISSPDSWFLVFLSVRVIVQPVLFVRAPAEALSSLQHLRQSLPTAGLFIWAFYTQITLLMGFTAEPAHSGAGMAKEAGKRREDGSEEMSTGRRCCPKKILLICKSHPLKPRIPLQPFHKETGHGAFLFLFLQTILTFFSFSKTKTSNCNHQLLPSLLQSQMTSL